MRNLRHAVALLVTMALPLAVHAGGPLYVAGSGFNSGSAGTPLAWAGGQISYYTTRAISARCCASRTPTASSPEPSRSGLRSPPRR